MFYCTFGNYRKLQMAFLSIKALGLWINNAILLILFYFLDFQKMVYVKDFEYLKARGIFMLFSVYFLSTVVLHIYKIYNARLDARIKEETLKAKKEIRKYIENKNKKNL